MKRNPIRRATRRTILAGIAATLVPPSLVARAQQHGAMPRLGVLMGALVNQPQGQANAAALQQGLGALGWKEGGNLRVDLRWAGSDPALHERDAAELVALGPEVILASNSQAVEALRRQTSTIPIVFTTVGDPVGQGFVKSLSHPGANITGFSTYDAPMAGKWLQMLTQITPPVVHVAVLYNPTTDAVAGQQMRVIEAAAPAIAVSARAAPCHDDAEIGAMMTALAHEPRGGVLVLPDPFTTLHRDTIVGQAARYRLPAVYAFRTFATAGGLMSYGIDQSDSYRRAAAYVDRILKGAKPADLPVQNPTKFELVLNLKTAKALGVTIATPLIATADAVIE